MTNFKLTYFSIRGFAEFTRLLFVVKKIPFEDVRLTREEFNIQKAAGVFAANMDRVPILNYGNFELGESSCIERFVSKKLGLSGSDEFEEAKIDSICECYRDLRVKFYAAALGKEGEEEKTAKTQFVVTEFPIWIPKIEKLVNNNGYAVGNGLSSADIALYYLFEESFVLNNNLKEEAAVVLELTPKIKEIVASVKELVKDYVDSRPVTTM